MIQSLLAPTALATLGSSANAVGALSLAAVLDSNSSTLTLCSGFVTGTAVYLTLSTMVVSPNTSVPNLSNLESTGSFAFGVGTDVSVSLAFGYDSSAKSSVLMALILMGDSFCWNNEVNNKRPTPALCDSTPIAMSEVLTYTYGPLSSIQSLFQNHQTVSSCTNNGLIHGMYDMGQFPIGALNAQPSPTANDLGLSMFGVHQGVGGTPKTAQCGNSMSFSASADAVVLDSFVLPNYNVD